LDLILVEVFALVAALGATPILALEFDGHHELIQAISCHW
jgi:hypothetical protein